MWFLHPRHFREGVHGATVTDRQTLGEGLVLGNLPLADMPRRMTMRLSGAASLQLTTDQHPEFAACKPQASIPMQMQSVEATELHPCCERDSRTMTSLLRSSRLHASLEVAQALRVSRLPRDDLRRMNVTRLPYSGIYLRHWSGRTVALSPQQKQSISWRICGLRQLLSAYVWCQPRYMT
jgi:hypothetical protein